MAPNFYTATVREFEFSSDLLSIWEHMLNRGRRKYADFDLVVTHMLEDEDLMFSKQFLDYMLIECEGDGGADFIYHLASYGYVRDRFFQSWWGRQIAMLNKFVAAVEVEQPVDEDHNDVDPDEEDAPFFHDEAEIDCDYITKHNITQAPVASVQPKQRAKIPTAVLVLVWIFFPLVGAAMMLYNVWNSD